MTNLGAWFRGLRGKLLFSAVLPVIGFAVIAFFSISGINKLNAFLLESNKVVIPTIQDLGDMNTELNAIARVSWFVYANFEDEAARSKAIESIRGKVEKFKVAQKAYEATDSTEAETQLYKTVKENWPKTVEEINAVISLFEKNTKVANELAKDRLLKNYRALTDPMEKNIDGIIQIYNQMVTENTKKSEETHRSVQAIAYSVSVGSSLAIFVIMLFMAVRLSGSIGQVASRLSDSAGNVNSSSGQLSAAGQELSASSTEAAASLEETVSSLEELSSMVKLNADNAKEAAALSQNSKASAEQGEAEIRTLIESMTDISQSSKKIEEIINVIDDIAFQTNLLALNAAVEAARAGEQGKGFAVVAEAVRSLAQRSAAAAKDITVLIKDSVSKIERGTKVADQSGSVLKNIVTSVKKVADLNTEISSASQEQSTGITQISQAMNQLDQATQTNASSAEEVAASSEQMSSQSTLLKDLVSELASIIDGANHETMASAEPVQQRVSARAEAPKLQLVSAAKRKTGKAQRSDAEKIIPLGNDAPVGKVGTTDGF